MNRPKEFAIYLNHPEVNCWNYKPREEDTFKRLFPRCTQIICKTKEEFQKALKAGAEVAFTWIVKENWLLEAKNLKHIVTPAAGLDYFALPEDIGPGIHNSGFHGALMAETLTAMVLCETRGLRTSWLLKEEKAWDRKILEGQMKRTRNQKALIIGFGSIGQAVGASLKNLGMEVWGMNRSLQPRPAYFSEQDKMYSLNEIDQVLHQADHIILVIPRNRESENLLNAQRIQRIKAGAVLYNIGRGNCIDEVALVEALKKGDSLQAAYLDVFKEEPLDKESPLWDLKNCFIMPHGSAIYPEYLTDFLREWSGKWEKGILDY